MTAHPSFIDQAKSAVVNGAMIMGVQTPMVNALNRISVVSSHQGYSTIQSARAIISGAVDHKPSASLWHLQRGLSGHLIKETIRLSFKPFGAAILKPKIDETFPTSPLKASLAFASVMSCMEMAINPADTIRVRLQSGESLHSLWPNPVKQLYAGSLGNGARQFGTWALFNFSGAYLDRFFSTYTTLDTKSQDGMMVKSAIQATLLTSVVYPIFERLKNELQLNPSLDSGTSSVYRSAFHGVIKRSGVIGFTHGLVPKILSNAILTYGFNWLVENGRARPAPKYTPLQIGSCVAENSFVRVSKVVVNPGDEPIIHYNEYPRIVIPLQSGILEKVDVKGNSIGERNFTRGVPVYSPKTESGNLHGNRNLGEEPLTFLIIEMKKV